MSNCQYSTAFSIDSVLFSDSHILTRFSSQIKKLGNLEAIQYGNENHKLYQGREEIETFLTTK